MRRLPEIDQVLRNAAERGDVPGIVAMAATRDGPVYQGAYGRRSLPSGAAMTADSSIVSRVKSPVDTADSDQPASP